VARLRLVREQGPGALESYLSRLEEVEEAGRSCASGPEVTAPTVDARPSPRPGALTLGQPEVEL
jgi:hypothetical protein